MLVQPKSPSCVSRIQYRSNNRLADSAQRKTLSCIASTLQFSSSHLRNPAFGVIVIKQVARHTFQGNAKFVDQIQRHSDNSSLPQPRRHAWKYLSFQLKLIRRCNAALFRYSFYSEFNHTRNVPRNFYYRNGIISLDSYYSCGNIPLQSRFTKEQHTWQL